MTFFNKQPLCLISHFAVWFFSLMFDFKLFQLFNFSIYFDDNTFCFLLWCVKFIKFLLLLLVISLLFDVQCGTSLHSLTENFFTTSLTYTWSLVCWKQENFKDKTFFVFRRKWGQKAKIRKCESVVLNKISKA